MRDYELMTIHRPDLAEDDMAVKILELEKRLTDQGATIEGRDLWGKRRFAYEIDHMSEGFYTVLTFSADADSVKTIDRALLLSDDVIRHKIVRKGD
jgi:small subunit ribosomal protein S6